MKTKYKIILVISTLTLLGHFLAAQGVECGMEDPPVESSFNQSYGISESSSSGQNCTIQYPAVLSFPVMHHIVRRSDGTGGMNPSLISQIMDDLNGAYSGAKIEFNECQSVINYINSTSLYDIISSSGEEDEFSSLGSYNDDNYINIYYVNSLQRNDGTTLSGRSSFPWSSPNDITAVDFDYADNGSTIPHELGHFFGLIHTHDENDTELVDGSNCTSWGDRLCDTPADPGLFDDYTGDGVKEYIVSTGCTYIGNMYGIVDGNNAYYNPDIANFMSYSQKHCRTHFSDCQLSTANYWANDGSRQALSTSPIVSVLKNLSINSPYSFSGENVNIDNVDITSTGDLTVTVCNEADINDFYIASGGKFLLTQ